MSISKKVLRDSLRTLGAREGESLTQIKTRYFKLAKVCHPDSLGEQASADRFKKVNEAYSWLKKYHETGASCGCGWESG